MVFGIHKAFRKKKDTVIPEVKGYQGGSLYNHVTGRTYTSDGRGEYLRSGQTTAPNNGLHQLNKGDARLNYNTPSYAREALQNYNTPDMKGHYSNGDVRRVDADILVLSQAMKDLNTTIANVERTNPNAIAQNQDLLNSYNSAVNYAMKQGFSMDQMAVDDRLNKYGYQDSSSKLGAMVALANKRVGTYLNAKLDQNKYSQDLKNEYLHNLRQDVDPLAKSINPLENSRRTMIDAMNNADKLETEQTQLRNNELLNREQMVNTMNQNNAREAYNADLARENLNTQRAGLEANIDDANIGRLQKAKRLQDLMYRPEQRIKNGYPSGFGAKLARGAVKVGASALGGYLGGPLGAKLGQGMTKELPW